MIESVTVSGYMSAPLSSLSVSPTGTSREALGISVALGMEACTLGHTALSVPVHVVGGVVSGRSPGCMTACVLDVS